MIILFIHQNFPGQYPHLAQMCSKIGYRVLAIGGPTARELPGVELHRYNPMPSTGIPTCHPWAIDWQTKCIRAEAVGRVLAQLKSDGLIPDLIIGHPGWGEMLCTKDIFGQTPVLHHIEYFYQLQGGDVGFDPEMSRSTADWSAQAMLRIRRAPQLLALHDLDWGWAPTHWQASTAPKEYADRVSVVHEGIDTTSVTPNKASVISLSRAGISFKPGDEVISYVARGLEPYRGFHIFMRMLAILQRFRPNMHAVIVGGENVSYGRPPASGLSWKQELLQELNGYLDLNRIHFAGQVPHPVLHDLFRVSRCHIYLTYPFVLSWSMLEAMACGAIVIGSDTEPVREVLNHGQNGILVDFFDAEAMAKTIASVLSKPDSYQHLKAAARQTIIEAYDLNTVCLPRQLQMINNLDVGGKTGDCQKR
jgi:glycosyltransferase involved in cell wall biosynthesis